MLRTDKVEVTETYQNGLDGFQNTLELTPAQFIPWAGDLQVGITGVAIIFLSGIS
jgi:hypothetical protein